jgi:hypothetical protein
MSSADNSLYDSGESNTSPSSTPPLHLSNEVSLAIPSASSVSARLSPTLPRLRLDRIQRDDIHHRLLSSSESSDGDDHSSSSSHSGGSRSFGRLDDAHGSHHHYAVGQASTPYYDEGCWSQYSGSDWTDDDTTPLASPAVPLRPGFARQIV